MNDVITLAEAERRAPPANGARYHVSDPLPLYPSLPTSRLYPVDALGSILGAAAEAIARKIQVPTAIAGQSVLAVASLAAQALADLELPFGQRRPLSVAAVTVAGSGDRKTSSDEEAAWPIKKHEKNLREQFDGDLEEFKIKLASFGAQKRKIETDKKLTREQREFELRALGSEPVPPLYPILTAPDPTVEGLAKAWTQAPASLGMFSAEGGQFVGGHGMTPESKLRTASALSELWDGRGMRRVRAGDGVTILMGRRLAMHLMIQREAGASFLTDPILKDQGFLSRILVAAPDTIAGTRFYRETRHEDESAIRHYGGHILTLLESPWPLAEGKRNELAPPTLTIEPNAQAVWRQYHDHIEAQCKPGGELDGVRDFAAKSAEQAARIAAILTIIRNPQSLTVELPEMQAGTKLADWHLYEAARLTSGARISPKLEAASRMLEWLKGQEQQPVHLRRILQFGPKALRTKSVAVDALNILAEHGYLSHDADLSAYRLAGAAA